MAKPRTQLETIALLRDKYLQKLEGFLEEYRYEIAGPQPRAFQEKAVFENIKTIETFLSESYQFYNTHYQNLVSSSKLVPPSEIEVRKKSITNFFLNKSLPTAIARRAQAQLKTYFYGPEIECLKAMDKQQPIEPAIATGHLTKRVRKAIQVPYEKRLAGKEARVISEALGRSFTLSFAGQDNDDDGLFIMDLAYPKLENILTSIDEYISDLPTDFVNAHGGSEKIKDWLIMHFGALETSEKLRQLQTALSPGMESIVRSTEHVACMNSFLSCFEKSLRDNQDNLNESYRSISEALALMMFGNPQGNASLDETEGRRPIFRQHESRNVSRVVYDEKRQKLVAQTIVFAKYYSAGSSFELFEKRKKSHECYDAICIAEVVMPTEPTRDVSTGAIEIWHNFSGVGESEDAREEEAATPLSHKEHFCKVMKEKNFVVVTDSDREQPIIPLDDIQKNLDEHPWPKFQNLTAKLLEKKEQRFFETNVSLRLENLTLLGTARTFFKKSGPLSKFLEYLNAAVPIADTKFSTDEKVRSFKRLVSNYETQLDQINQLLEGEVLKPLIEKFSIEGPHAVEENQEDLSFERNRNINRALEKFFYSANQLNRAVNDILDHYEKFDHDDYRKCTEQLTTYACAHTKWYAGLHGNLRNKCRRNYESREESAPWENRYTVLLFSSPLDFFYPEFQKIIKEQPYSVPFYKELVALKRLVDIYHQHWLEYNLNVREKLLSDIKDAAEKCLNPDHAPPAIQYQIKITFLPEVVNEIFYQTKLRPYYLKLAPKAIKDVLDSEASLKELPGMSSEDLLSHHIGGESPASLLKPATLPNDALPSVDTVLIEPVEEEAPTLRLVDTLYLNASNKVFLPTDKLKNGKEFLIKIKAKIDSLARLARTQLRNTNHQDAEINSLLDKLCGSVDNNSQKSTNLSELNHHTALQILIIHRFLDPEKLSTDDYVRAAFCVDNIIKNHTEKYSGFFGWLSKLFGNFTFGNTIIDAWRNRPMIKNENAILKRDWCLQEKLETAFNNLRRVTCYRSWFFSKKTHKTCHLERQEFRRKNFENEMAERAKRRVDSLQAIKSAIEQSPFETNEALISRVETLYEKRAPKVNQPPPSKRSLSNGSMPSVELDELDRFNDKKQVAIEKLAQHTRFPPAKDDPNPQLKLTTDADIKMTSS